MSCVRLAAALLIALIGLSSSPPCAARPPFELSWSAPAECPSGAEVSAALARLAEGGSPVGAASVEIVPVAGRWQATLSTRGAQRRLEGESCAAVVHALTVVLALAVAEAEPAPRASAARASGATRGGASAPDAPLASAAERAGTPSVEGPVAVATTDSGLAWAVRAGLLAELGMLPGPTLGPQATVELHLGPWSAELGATLLLPRHARLAGEGSPEGDIDWLGGQMAACRQLHGALSLCLGAEAGRLSGSGSGVDEPSSATGWWLAASAGAHVRGLFSRSSAFSWRLGLSAAAALARPEFGFDQLGLLHRPSAISGRLFFGLGWGH